MTQEKPNYKMAEEKALELLKKYGYTKPPINPIAIAEAEGIDISFVQFDEKYSNVSGLYDFNKREILVNAEENPNRQIFTVAHELGHVEMHADWVKSNEYKVLLRTGEYDSDPKEREADAFAAHLLVPKFLLKKYCDIATKSELARLFGVSEIVINKRLERLYW